MDEQPGLQPCIPGQDGSPIISMTHCTRVPTHYSPHFWQKEMVLLPALWAPSELLLAFLPIALRIRPNTCLLFVACNSRFMSTLFHKSFGLKSTFLKLRRRSFLHLIIFAGWSHCIAVEGKISLHHFCVETRFCSILQNGARLAIAKHLCLVCIKIKAETRGS